MIDVGLIKDLLSLSTFFLTPEIDLDQENIVPRVSPKKGYPAELLAIQYSITKSLREELSPAKLDIQQLILN